MRIGSRRRTLDQVAGDAAAVSLLSVLVNQIGQSIGVKPFDQPPRGLAAGRIEPQVERSGRVEAESPLGIGQLIARKSQVQQDAINVFDFQLRQHRGQFAIAGSHEFHRQSGQTAFGRRQGRRVAIERHDKSLAPDALGQGSRVAAAAQGAVDQRLPGPRVEPLEHRGQQDAHMSR